MTEPAQTAPKPPAAAARLRRSRRRLTWLVGTALALLCGAELVGRVGFGLGHPPLFMADPKIEYLYQPNQDLHRFGSHLHFNAYSMRADDFPAHKTDPRELRVMVLGDSVVNGGAKTDQSELATTILQRELASRLKRPVIVGNISSPSWGPPNMLAYAKRFGFFDADVVVIVLNSNDSFDVPTYAPIVGVLPDYPDHRPLLALEEAAERYIIPRLRFGTGKMEEAPSLDKPARQSDVDESLSAVRELIDLARSRGARVIVAQHLERAEARGQPKFGHAEIGQVARSSGAEVVALGPAFRDALNAGKDPYQPLPNLVHPNALGQRLIADQLIEPIITALPPGPR
jgi:lysophospholipase L1-like esterase